MAVAGFRDGATDEARRRDARRARTGLRPITTGSSSSVSGTGSARQPSRGWQWRRIMACSIFAAVPEHQLSLPPVPSAGRARARRGCRRAVAGNGPGQGRPRGRGQHRVPPGRRDAYWTGGRQLRRGCLRVRRILRRRYGCVRGGDVAAGPPGRDGGDHHLGHRLWEPASTCFWQSVRALDSSPFKAFNP